MVVLVAILVAVECKPVHKSHQKMREASKKKMKAKTTSMPSAEKQIKVELPKKSKLKAQIGSLMVDLEKSQMAKKAASQSLQTSSPGETKNVEKKLEDMAKQIASLTHQVKELEEEEYAHAHKKKISGPQSSVGGLKAMTVPATQAAAVHVEKEELEEEESEDSENSQVAD